MKHVRLASGRLAPYWNTFLFVFNRDTKNKTSNIFSIFTATDIKPIFVVYPQKLCLRLGYLPQFEFRYTINS